MNPGRRLLFHDLDLGRVRHEEAEPALAGAQTEIGIAIIMREGSRVVVPGAVEDLHREQRAAAEQSLHLEQPVLLRHGGMQPIEVVQDGAGSRRPAG